jgi:hypothetical protein
LLALPKGISLPARIAALASQSERWVRHCLRSLQKKGLIEVHYRRDGQVQDTNFYTVEPDRILMQAGKRATTTLKRGGTQFRLVGNSVPVSRGELTAPKQSALDKHQDNGEETEQSNITLKETSQATCPQGELLDYQVIQIGPQIIDPCLQEVVISDSNNPTHPHPPTSWSPPPPSLPTASNQKVAPEAPTDARKTVATAPAPGSDIPPSPSELANMSPWDRAYEQALDAWRKEHANLTPAEAREAFDNDTEFLTRVAKIFHEAQIGAGRGRAIE